MEMYPDGITLTSEIYSNLLNSIQRDCRVLESFKIMDYSLLIGIHNIDQVKYFYILGALQTICYNFHNPEHINMYLNNTLL